MRDWAEEVKMRKYGLSAEEAEEKSNEILSERKALHFRIVP